MARDAPPHLIYALVLAEKQVGFQRRQRAEPVEDLFHNNGLLRLERRATQ